MLVCPMAPERLAAIPVTYRSESKGADGPTKSSSLHLSSPGAGVRNTLRQEVRQIMAAWRQHPLKRTHGGSG